MAELIFKDTIDVDYVQHVGDDNMIAHAAWVSTKGFILGEPEPAKVAGLLNFLTKNRHGTPFEHGSLTVRVHAPIKVWREWHRHRIGWCLAGDSQIWTETVGPNSGRTVRKRPIADIYHNWHHGVSDAVPKRTGRGVVLHESGLWRATGTINKRQVHLGYFETENEAQQKRQEWANENPTTRTRLLPSCRNLPARVLNEKTQFFEIGRMADVFESGIKELFLLQTEPGHELRGSKDHRILTMDGWASLGDLRRGDRIAVVGKRSKFAERNIPPALRRGIGVWTSMQRCRLIKETDRCYVCGEAFSREQLVLDHVVPVVSDLVRALDVNNLKPICDQCGKIKTAGEQCLANRGNVAGSKYVRVAETPKRIGEGMTYDISMEGPHHNFVANGIVVHNSYNEESGRYKQLEPIFWVPPITRPMMRPEGFRSAMPNFDFATVEEYEATCEVLKEGYTHAYGQYEKLLALGVDRGLARDVLGVGIYSACYCTANPRSIMAFFELRTNRPDAKRPSKPLWEIAEAARQLEQIFAEHWPVTYKVWNENGRQAP